MLAPKGNRARKVAIATPLETVGPTEPTKASVHLGDAVPVINNAITVGHPRREISIGFR